MGNRPPMPSPNRHGHSRLRCCGLRTRPQKPAVINPSNPTNTRRLSRLRLARAGASKPDSTSIAVKKPSNRPALCSLQPFST
ncbi:hypothetical protein D3C80_2078440 [compost metagenome]